MARKRLGEVLLSRRALTPKQLEDALAIHRRTRERLGHVLVTHGFITEIGLVQALSEALLIPLVDVQRVTPDGALLKVLKASFCEMHGMLPLSTELAGGRKQLVVAMADPLNLTAIEEAEFRTGLKVTPRLAPASALHAAILRHYHGVTEPDGGDEEFVIIQRGGHIVPTGDAAEPVLELTDEHVLSTAPPGRGTNAGTLQKDLSYLLGEDVEAARIEQLEQKFWALMRLLVKKKVITQKEFEDELE